MNTAAALASTNYTATVDSNDPTKVDITLNDSSKLAHGDYVSVTVSKSVLDTNLNGLKDDSVNTFTFLDTSAPTVSSVVVKGNDLEVTFNDYVSAVGLAKVDGVQVTPTVAATPALSKTVVLTGAAAGLADGAHTVTFANVKDINATPNNTVFTSGSFTISSNQAAPTVSKVEGVDSDTFKVTFNKAVTAPTVTVKKNGLDLTVTGVNATADPAVWTVDVADNGGVTLYNSGETSVSLAVNVSAYQATSDNTVGDAVTQMVTLSKDTTAPVVQSRFNDIATIAGSSEVLNIQFNESITNADMSKIILTDSNGVRQTVDSATVVNDAAGNPTILQVASAAIQTAGAINPGNYTVSLGAGTVTDLSNNVNAATTATFTKASAPASQITAVAYATGNTITIPYGVDMTSSAISASNYSIDNKALPSGTILYFSGTQQTVVIELPAGSVANNSDVLLSISPNVVSQAGETLDSATKNQIVSGLVDNVQPKLLSATKTDATHVTLTFSEDLGTITDSATSEDDFTVKVNGVNFAVAAVANGGSANQVVLTVGSYNTNQTVSVGTATSTLEVKDLNNNVIVGGTTVTASK